MKKILGLCLVLTASTPPLAAEISAARILARTTILASDAFEGRAPGTPGEEQTINYLIAEAKKIGLEPGNPDGTYVQSVKTAGITSHATLTFTTGTSRLTPHVGTEFIALSRRRQPLVEIPASELVFVGYGVTAPEFGWDDFKDVDVRGKTVVMLINDPPVLAAATGKLDETVFGGRAMTYYGRWTYKFESASARGAAAVLIVHETGPAGYPFAVLAAGSGRETFDVGTAETSAARVAAEGWITLDTARQLFSAAGQDFAALKAAASQRDFRPVALSASASFAIKNELREVVSRNFIARLPGADPTLRAEHVIYSAHWDAYGRDHTRSGDQILNGAADNAIAVAMMLEIAEAAAALPAGQRARRSLLFFAPTYEEKGILGSKFYTENPLHPLVTTVANLNLEPLDAGVAYEPTRDLEIVGRNPSTIDDWAAEIAAAQDRVLRADSEPEKGYYYRSDHIEFAKVGVPAFFVRSGLDVIGVPPGTGAQRRQSYLQNDYHKITDEVRPDWTCAGAAHDARFLFALGLRIANAAQPPAWKPGTEFKAIRDAQLKAAAH